jgi:N-acetylmuramoyl-L-alanine amidase
MPSKSRIILPFIAFSIIFIAICTLFFILSSSLIKPSGRDTSVSNDYPTVIIDAGHGGEDGGAVGINGVLEKDVNLAIAKRLYEELTKSGIECVLTRSEDILLYDRNQDYEGRKKALDMQARLNTVSKYENAIFVSIHQNSFPVEKYNGFQAYYSDNSEASQALATTIEQSIKNSLQTNNNRVAKPSEGKIYLLDNLTCPAVLLECGFLSNTNECEQLCSDAYQTRMCNVISDGIIAFLNKNQQ